MKKWWQLRSVKIAIWSVLGLTLVIVLGLVARGQRTLRVDDIDITIEPQLDNFYVSRDEVLKTINSDTDSAQLIGQPLSNYDPTALESLLEQNPYIENAEVYKEISGKLRVKIIQKQPVLRVINSFGESYYIDDKGKKMPVSDNFTSRVIVATGNIFERYHGTDSAGSVVLKGLFDLSTAIQQDEFWKAQIEQINVDKAGDFQLIPKVGDHIIEFGTAEDAAGKFKRLKVFYQQGLSKVGWSKYRKISVKFKDQIVCTKK